MSGKITIVSKPPKLERKKRVAAYARVSSGKDAMLHSLSAQVSYYNDLIQNHGDWLYAGVYSDEAKTGTKDSRAGFQNLVADCRACKIDMVITKSISRFARNTVTLLQTVREFKALGVDIYFEEQNIHTMSGDGELMMTILASYAQEESRSASENQKWRVKRNFEAGIPWDRTLLGYRMENAHYVIVPKEAEIVRRIYNEYLSGSGYNSIAKMLNDEGVSSRFGGKWNQKSFTVDFLQKKTKPNEGEVPQYYVEGSHPAIIEPDEWDHVQAEFARRKELGNAYSGKSVLSAKLVCEDCGGFFGSKVWHSTDRYRRTVWQCNNKFKGGERCLTPTVDTETVQQLFIKAYNQMMGNRKQIIEDCELMRKKLTDFKSLDADIERQFEETQIVAELVKAAVKENAVTAQSQEAYLEKYEALTQRYETAAAELERLQNLRTLRSQKNKAMALYIRTLKNQPIVLNDWNNTLWNVMVEKAIVHRNGEITFVFYNGTKVRVK